MKNIILILVVLNSPLLYGQTNVSLTSSKAESFIKGNYLPSSLIISGLNENRTTIIQAIEKEINTDSLRSYIVRMSEFETRHTSSDTNSLTEGIGAARRWAYKKFEEFAEASNDRLAPSYMQFSQDICGVGQHRNILAVLPGSNPAYKDIVLLEAHIDSRCESGCDAICSAQGVEDNATGSAMVLELARVLSKCVLDRTVVFMLTIGEEQGLHGASAFVKYAQDNNIAIRAVLNNDVVGSVLCGKTASQPGCSGENEVDSTQFRIFSSGNFNSRNKQFARYCKLQYDHDLRPNAKVPMDITIMSAEDRTGRGGDHIPFRKNGFTAIRFTAANEHGNAAISQSYSDRQHTSADILGADTDNDGEVDSFYIDFNYLKRNTQINAISTFGASTSLPTPQAEFFLKWGNNVVITIKDEDIAPYYAFAYRSNTNDWDSIIVLKGAKSMDVWVPANEYLSVSVAALNDQGLESLFSEESRFLPLSTRKVLSKKSIELFSNYPNPSDETTTISVYLNKPIVYFNAQIVIKDGYGKVVETLPMYLEPGLNEVNYNHGYNASGIYLYSLIIDGEVVQTNKMLFK